MMPILYCRCGEFNGMGRMSTDVPGKLLLSSGFTKTWLAAERRRGRRGCCLVHGCPSQGWEQLYISNARRRARTCTGTQRERQSNLTGRRLASYFLSLLSVLPDANDRGHEARRCRVDFTKLALT